MDNIAILQNNHLRAVFDLDAGKLIELTNVVTGWKIQKRAELALAFNMLVPIPDRRNNQVHGEFQKLYASEVDNENKIIKLVWKNLQSVHGGILDITFTGIVRLDSDGLTFNATVENNSPYVIECVGFPQLGDITQPIGGKSLTRMSYGYAGMACAQLLPYFANERGYFGTDFPIQMVPTPDTPFVLVAAEKEGLYLGCHDEKAKELVQFTFELKPGYESSPESLAPQGGNIGGQVSQLVFSCTHFPFAAPKETIELSPIVMNPYYGTWHNGVDNYKKWRATWFKRPASPEWARDIHSWQQIHINSPEDELRCSYNDLVKYGEDCVKHGVKAIQLVGWNNGGQDRGNPSHDTDPRLGTWEELKDAIAKIQAMGVSIILFTKFTWADRSQQWFRDELIKYSVKDPYGDYIVYPGYQYQTPTQLSDINTRRLVPMCMNSDKWREICGNELKKVIALGAVGMLYDECQHHGGARYCFDQSHGHHTPAAVYAGDRLLCEGFNKITDQLPEPFLYAGEACYDLEMNYYSIYYFRLYSGLNHIPLQRYIDPQSGLMAAIYGYDDRNAINQCLLYRYIMSYEPLNFKGRLDEFPLSIEYGKKVDVLRKQYREFLWDAEFIDTLEATIEVDPNRQFAYSVYKQKESGKRAVVIANYDRDHFIMAKLKLENSSGQFMIASPEQIESRRSDANVVIAPRSAVVLMEV